MSTWTEDFNDGMHSFGLPSPGEFGAEEIVELIEALREYKELHVKEALEYIAARGAGGAAVAAAMLAAGAEAVALLATVAVATYAGALVVAALYASAKQGWEILTAPIDLEKLLEWETEYEAPVLELPASEEVSWYPEVAVAHETVPRAPDYPGQIVKRNSTDTDSVERIQTALEANGYDLGEGGVDGKYGNDTFNAVKAFQEERGIKVDGEVGEETWKALFGSN